METINTRSNAEALRESIRALQDQGNTVHEIAELAMLAAEENEPASINGDAVFNTAMAYGNAANRYRDVRTEANKKDMRKAYDELSNIIKTATAP